MPSGKAGSIGALLHEFVEHQRRGAAAQHGEQPLRVAVGQEVNLGTGVPGDEPQVPEADAEPSVATLRVRAAKAERGRAPQAARVGEQLRAELGVPAQRADAGPVLRGGRRPFAWPAARPIDRRARSTR